VYSGCSEFKQVYFSVLTAQESVKNDQLYKAVLFRKGRQG